MSLTLLQRSNLDGFPKPGELIEVTGHHLLEASDRAILNTLLQHAHETGKMSEAEAEWEMSFAKLREEVSKHESNDRLRNSLDRLGNVKVVVRYTSKDGEARTLTTPLDANANRRICD